MHANVESHHHHLQSPPPLTASKPRLKPPPRRRTSPLAWFVAALCAILWTAIILGGLAVLIVYLVFRPRNPRLSLSSASLNAAYIDTDEPGSPLLLNADLTVLAMFSNPNEKAGASFRLIEVDLYVGGVLLATRGVEGFGLRPGDVVLRSVEMVASQVALSPEEAEGWRRQVEEGRIGMEVRSRLRTRLDLGGFLHFTYWLHGSCSIVLSDPPGGVLLSSDCRTKR